MGIASRSGVDGQASKGTTHVVIDTPGGLGGWRFKEVVSRADKLLIPIMPSIFDMFASQAFIEQLREITKTGKTKLGIIGMRVDERTVAAGKLREFMEKLDVPIIGFCATHSTTCTWLRTGSACLTSRRRKCKKTWNSGRSYVNGWKADYFKNSKIASATLSGASRCGKCPTPLSNCLS